MFCVSAVALEFNFNEKDKSSIAKQTHNNFIDGCIKKPTYCKDYTSQEILHILKDYISTNFALIGSSIQAII